MKGWFSIVPLVVMALTNKLRADALYFRCYTQKRSKSKQNEPTQSF